MHRFYFQCTTSALYCQIEMTHCHQTAAHTAEDLVFSQTSSKAIRLHACIIAWVEWPLLGLCRHYKCPMWCLPTAMLLFLCNMTQLKSCHVDSKRKKTYISLSDELQLYTNRRLYGAVHQVKCTCTTSKRLHGYLQTT